MSYESQAELKKISKNPEKNSELKLLNERITEYIYYVENNIEGRNSNYNLLNDLLDKNDDLRSDIINLKHILENPMFIKNKLYSSDYEDIVGNFLNCLILNFNRIAEGKKIRDTAKQEYNTEKLIKVLKDKIEDFYTQFGIKNKKAA